LIHHRKGQFVFPVKENRRALFDAVNILPWQDIPIAHRSVDKGHGRVTTRTIQVMPAPEDLPFPHVNQVWLVERYVTDTAGRPISAVAQLGVAGHITTAASPAELARCVQGQWAIEVLHWIRDTPLPRGQLHRPQPLRRPRDGLAAQFGRWRLTAGRALRHHRGHPMGLPQHDQAIRDPRHYIMILRRPCRQG
jgi:hypothetical protein